MKKTLVTLICIILTACLFIPSAVAEQASGYNHTVTKGETFWSIAKQYDISLNELQKANANIRNIALIYPGQLIFIPNTDPLKSVEQTVLQHINQHRAKHHLPALKNNRLLNYAARKKARDMVEYHYFAHQSPTYGSPFTMILDCGLDFSAAGENIARGQQTASQAVTDWINSEGNRANILSNIYTTAGIGASKTAKGTYYFCLLLIKEI